MDVTDPSSISDAFTRIGGPDIVIANAGTGTEAELTATSLSGGVKMAYGTQDSVEGQFMITICAP